MQADDVDRDRFGRDRFERDRFGRDRFERDRFGRDRSEGDIVGGDPQAGEGSRCGRARRDVAVHWYGHIRWEAS